MEYNYKICNLCDASGYDRNTKVKCPICNGKGIIFPKKIKEEKKEEKKRLISHTSLSC